MLEFVSVELFKVKKYSKARKVFEFLKLTAKPEKVMESHGIWRAQKTTNPVSASRVNDKLQKALQGWLE